MQLHFVSLLRPSAHATALHAPAYHCLTMHRLPIHFLQCNMHFHVQQARHLQHPTMTGFHFFVEAAAAPHPPRSLQAAGRQEGAAWVGVGGQLNRLPGVCRRVVGLHQCGMRLLSGWVDVC